MFRNFANNTVISCTKLIVRNASSDGTVGFVGLGTMGRNMAGNLAKKGTKLVVYDINNSAVKDFASATGATVAKTAGEVAGSCSRVFTMLPTNSHVLDVYSKELVPSASKGSLLVDCSTVSPGTSQTVSKLAAENGVEFLDSPVSGAEPAARDATLTFMVGGKKEQLKRIEELLMQMGKRIFHCGDVGSGEAAKICNNMLLAIGMIGTSEALILAQRLGLDAKLMTDIINVSSGRCWSSEIYNPHPGINENVPAGREYTGGFLTKLISKDLGLAQESANSTKTPTPLGSTAHQIFQLMSGNGYEEKDFSVVYQFMKKQQEQK